MQLSLSEQFMLLALDRDSGMFTKPLSGMLGFYLAASGLLELIEAGVILLDENDRVTHDRFKKPAGLPHLDLIAGKINKRPDSAKHVITSLYSWKGRTLHKQVIDSMENRGLLERHQKKSLYFFRFTFWRTSGNAQESLIGRLRDEVLADRNVDEETLPLVLLAAHAKALQRFFFAEEQSRLKDRLAEMESSHNSAVIRQWYSQLKQAYTEAVSSGSF